ncbi:MAG: hypothetical protein KME13_23870 [Myxacorys californica WJT36-NPBG1]|jgi:hypothetical protein|nr:hypothetical protein [Myxacorys californica WJT36-NPBG1]
MFQTNRVSIKNDLMKYVEAVATDLELTELTDVIAVILLDHKRGFCQPICKAEALSKSAPGQSTTSALNDPTEGLGDLF